RARPRLRPDASRHAMNATTAPVRRSLRRPRPAASSAVRPARAVSARWALPGLAALLVGALLLSLGAGSVAIAPGEALAIVGAKLGLGAAEGVSPQQELVLLYVRLPRVLLGVLVGAALGVSGAVMQGLFRNPLAEPGLVGVSAGSALGAVAFIVLGGSLALSPLAGAVALP